MATYEDFQKQVAALGMDYNTWSDADKELALKNPDAGISLANYKKDWQNASTPAAKALANENANLTRQSYGGYSGGADGSGYYVNSKAEQGVSDTLDSIANYGDFKFDAETNPLYQSYKKQYTKNADTAYKNALAGQVNKTGGNLSSYGAVASQQAYADQMDNLSNIIPTVYSQAYNEYQNGLTNKQNLLSAYQTERANEQSQKQYADALKQQQYENEFAQKQYSDTLAQQQFENEQTLKQNALTNAMNKWTTYGYVSEDIADTLGLPVGTPTSSQAYNDYQIALAQAKSSSGSTSGSSTSNSVTDYTVTDGTNTYTIDLSNESQVRTAIARGITDDTILAAAKNLGIEVGDDGTVTATKTTTDYSSKNKVISAIANGDKSSGVIKAAYGYGIDKDELKKTYGFTERDFLTDDADKEYYDNLTSIGFKDNYGADSSGNLIIGVRISTTAGKGGYRIQNMTASELNEKFANNEAEIIDGAIWVTLH